MNNGKSKTKKFIIFLLILILIGIGIYYFFAIKKVREDVATIEPEIPVTFTIGNKDIELNQATTSTNQNNRALENEETVITGNGVIPKLRKLSQSAVAGMTSRNIVNGKETKTSVRFIERATGHVYEMATDSWTLEKISNTTIPKIYNAIWSKDPNSLYVRRILDNTEEIETFFATLKPTAATSTNPQESADTGNYNTGTKFAIEGVYLPKNIENLAVGNDGKKIFYFTTKEARGLGILSNTNGVGGSEIWDSPLVEFLISWPKEDIVTFTTKPSASIEGFMYFLNRNTLKAQKTLGGVLGLTTLTSPDAQNVLYGESKGGRYNLKMLDNKGKTSSTISLSTFPEKCVWSNKDVGIIYCAVPFSWPKGSYPDSWYQGITSFNDEIWQINLTTGANKMLAKPEEMAGETIDGINLSLSKDEDHLFFLNKKDSSLWSLRLVDKTASTTLSGE